jgi:hypothetical protein
LEVVPAHVGEAAVGAEIGPVLSDSVISKSPASPSKARGVPAAGSSETAMPSPVRKLTVYDQEPVAGGEKWARHLSPELAPVSMALPSAAKKPGTVRDSAPLVNVTFIR